MTDSLNDLAMGATAGVAVWTVVSLSVAVLIGRVIRKRDVEAENAS